MVSLDFVCASCTFFSCQRHAHARAMLRLCGRRLVVAFFTARCLSFGCTHLLRAAAHATTTVMGLSGSRASSVQPPTPSPDHSLRPQHYPRDPPPTALPAHPVTLRFTILPRAYLPTIHHNLPSILPKAHGCARITRACPAVQRWTW